MEQLKISNKYLEYVNNVEQVEHILNQCEYDLEYLTTNENKRKYNLIINDLKFSYFEGMGHELVNSRNKQDKMLNAIWCLLSDMSFYNQSATEYDFIYEMGYNDNAKTMEEGHKIYLTIQRNNEKLLKCFSQEQLEFLTDNINL